MRRIREVLRLKLLCGLSHREIARALGVSVGAVSHYGQLAEQAGLAWPEVEAIDEAQLEARLMPRAPPVGRRVLPDFTAIHQELKRKGVTLQLLWEEYVAAHSGETTYTIGFSGFNTAMQAVQCGLPMVTREGRFMRGRFASGILRRMGLSELVAGSEEDYVALTVKLVQDAAYRHSVRTRLEASRPVLFEDLAPIGALEDFLLATMRDQRRPR
jgi:hypothetical protein